jgi:hypothetical protein
MQSLKNRKIPMFKKLIRFGLIAVICGGAVFSNDFLSRRAIQYEAMQFYDRQGYRPDLAIRFEPGQLQQYSVEVSTYATQSSTAIGTGIWLVAAFLIVGVLHENGKAPSKAQLLFQSWIKAAQKNDSLAMAKIETEVINVDATATE